MEATVTAFRQACVVRNQHKGRALLARKFEHGTKHGVCCAAIQVARWLVCEHASGPRNQTGFARDAHGARCERSGFARVAGMAGRCPERTGP